MNPEASPPVPFSDRWSFYGLLLLLVWLPLPLGANRPWSWGLMEIWVFLLLAFWALDRFRYPRPLEGFLATYPMIFVPFALWSLYPLVQLVGLPQGLIRLVSPSALEVHLFAGASKAWFPLSMDPYLTTSAWLKGMAYLGAFWLALATATQRHRLRLLAITLFGGVPFRPFGRS